MRVIRKSDWNRARYIVGDVVGTAAKGQRVQVQWAHSRSELLPSSLVELDEAKRADLLERVTQRKTQERVKWIEERPYVCVNVNPLARVDNHGHRKGPILLLPSQVQDGKCYYCGAPVVARCQRCENPASPDSPYCEQCQPAQQDQHKLASMSDEALAELGLTRSQVEAWDNIIERQQQEAREGQRFLDVMHD